MLKWVNGLVHKPKVYRMDEQIMDSLFTQLIQYSRNKYVQDGKFT